MHVKEPTGTEVYFSNPKSMTTGARLSKDFTAGFGPEVYTLRDAPAGEYEVCTTYYASHQQSSATGATSAVVWTIQNMGTAKEKIEFGTQRLTVHGQKTLIRRVQF